MHRIVKVRLCERKLGIRGHMNIASREVRLASRPTGTPTRDNFELAEVRLSTLSDGHVRVRNLWMSVDPYMRGRMRDYESYLPPFQIGQALEGAAVGEVLESNDPEFRVGDIVLSMLGWREVFDTAPRALRRPPAPVASPEMYLGVCGNTGHTAYIGLTDTILLEKGDVIFISAAAGAVGSLACQIARLLGATVIGSAGGAEKIEYLRSIGVEHVIDYKSVGDMTQALRDLAPDGIDAYFDNVGGDHLDAALACARNFARFALCGMISGYNGESAGPRNLLMAIEKRLFLQGFLVSDHLSDRAAFIKQMNEWLKSGEITFQQTVEHGIEQAPAAFLKLFTGENIGKMLVKL
jgi:NADPH-dependent curcumin reductase CurA